MEKQFKQTSRTGPSREKFLLTHRRHVFQRKDSIWLIRRCNGIFRIREAPLQRCQADAKAITTDHLDGFERRSGIH